MLEKVDKFCYIEDILDADTGYDSAMMTKAKNVYGEKSTDAYLY